MRRPQRLVVSRLSGAVVAFALASLSPLAGVADKAQMPKSIEEAIRVKRADALPRTSFYDSPALDTSKPGDLLWQEAVAGHRSRRLDCQINSISTNRNSWGLVLMTL
jgi:hypothetical protein